MADIGTCYGTGTSGIWLTKEAETVNRYAELSLLGDRHHQDLAGKVNRDVGQATR